MYQSFVTPALAEADVAVLDEIEAMREQLRLWRGSNSIEGYQVSRDDAVAMMEDEEPLDADRQTALEITGHGLPERSLHALYAAAMGLQVRRPVYEKDAEVEAGTAARDLRALVAAG